MVTPIDEMNRQAELHKKRLSKKTMLKIFTLAVMIIYSLVTIFPFYVLLVRSFVSTKDSTDLHLWIPDAQDVSMDAEVGNLAVFYDLDLTDLKDALGIPRTEFLMARTTLREVSQQFDIPEEEIVKFFDGFYTYNGWRTLLSGTAFWSALGRTLLITVISLAGIILLSMFTGYGLAGLKRRDQMAVYNIYILQMVIPGFLILLPQFLIIQWVWKLFPGFEAPGITRYGLQILGLILINIKGTALSTMIFTSAISAIPKDMEDSAQIDGASPMQYIRHILFPLLKVPIVSLVVIMLPAFYNQFLEPYVYLDPTNTTILPMTQTVAGQFSTNFQVIYAAVLASVLPLVFVYIVFRRYFIQGVMAGAVKG